MYTKGSNDLCSIYILPLVGLNSMSFGQGNFIKSYVNEDNVHVVVQLKNTTTIIKNQSNFRFEFNKDGDSFAVFEVPVHLRETMNKFREGKYSEFSDEAKSIVRKKSGLRYNVLLPNGKLDIAKKLLVLDKHKDLRLDLERELDVKLHPNAELGSIPDEDNFFTLGLSKSLPSEVNVIINV